jgi:tetratricopeptide (TPR) repeat protein
VIEIGAARSISATAIALVWLSFATACSHKTNVTVGQISQSQIIKESSGCPPIMVAVNNAPISAPCTINAAIPPALLAKIEKLESENIEIKRSLRTFLEISKNQQKAGLSSVKAAEVSKFLEQGRLEDARRLQDEIAQQATQSGALENYKAAWLALARQDDDSALSHFRLAHEGLPEDPIIAFWYATALNKAVVRTLRDTQAVRRADIEILQKMADLDDRLSRSRFHSEEDNLKSQRNQLKEQHLTQVARAKQLESEIQSKTDLTDRLMTEAATRLAELAPRDPLYMAYYSATLAEKAAKEDEAGQKSEARKTRAQMRIAMRTAIQSQPSGPQKELSLLNLKALECADDATDAPEGDADVCFSRQTSEIIELSDKYASQDPAWRFTRAVLRLVTSDRLVDTQPDKAYAVALQGWHELEELRTGGIPVSFPELMSFPGSETLFAEAPVYVAHTEEALKKYQAAEGHYQDTINSFEALDSDKRKQFASRWAFAYYELGKLLSSQKRFEEAADKFDHAIQLYESADLTDDGESFLAETYVLRFQLSASLKRRPADRCAYLVKGWNRDKTGALSQDDVKQAVAKGICAQSLFHPKTSIEASQYARTLGQQTLNRTDAASKPWRPNANASKDK